ncbi:TetR/AcrR family transcriptional regulator [Luteibacter rhizovicinus]|nr:TetR/AcrR family transcriptional regulator [Luteibacter rhizovicinus]
MTKRDAPAMPVGGAKSQRTRDKLLSSARFWFSERSYDAVGVREIAQRADVDPAMISRHFGGKQGLFVAACDGAFDVVAHLPADSANIGRFLAGAAVGTSGTEDPDGFNALSLLLLSSDSPEVAEALSAAFKDGFINPLAAKLSGKDAAGRAAAIAACVVGLATVCHRLGLGSRSHAAKAAERSMGDAIQRMVDDRTEGR